MYIDLVPEVMVEVIGPKVLWETGVEVRVKIIILIETEDAIQGLEVKEAVAEIQKWVEVVAEIHGGV